MRVLDLFAGAGGAGKGYMLAGNNVIGVDINEQPEYPSAFVEMDAMKYLEGLIESGAERWFDFIHASPPCQAHSALTKGTNKGNVYEDFIPRVRALLDQTGLPYVIENVAGAPIRKDLMLCGEMFGLGVIRHRYFELGGWRTDQPAHLKHRGRVAGWRHGTWYDGPYFAVYGEGGGKGSIQEWQQAMGVTHISTRKGLAESIPSAYTSFIATRFTNWKVFG